MMLDGYSKKQKGRFFLLFILSNVAIAALLIFIFPVLSRETHVKLSHLLITALRESKIKESTNYPLFINGEYTNIWH